MRILAIDPALRNTGYVLAEYLPSTDEIVYITTGVIHTKTSTHTGQNLVQDANYILTQLAALLPQCDVVVSEVSTFSQNADNATTNGIVISILGYVSTQKKLFLITQSDAKLYASDKELCSKQEVMEWAKAILPCHLIPRTKKVFNHVADAVAVLHASIKTLKKENHL